MTRGLPRNVKLIKQAYDFSGLRIRNITPTDIDAMLEFRLENCFLFIEYKFYDGSGQSYLMEKGQSDALTALCDDVRRPACLLIALHNTSKEKLIDGARAGVYSFYFEKTWFVVRPGEKMQTVSSFVDSFVLKNRFIHLGKYIPK